MLEKIISGGQTGADRAALDAALAAGFPCGGYCPRGREAEDGVIDAHYPLEEIEGGYAERTRKNVQAADATVAFYTGTLTGGTLQTVNYCREQQKPCHTIDIERLDDPASIRSLAGFLQGRDIRVLNVAGPRESGSPGIHARVGSIIAGLIKQLQGSD